MRIPVYPDDLISNRGFKSLAKQLRNLLHGPSRVPLAFAQSLLARGLGYRDYHHLEQYAKSDSPESLIATPNAAKLAIFSGIQAALETSDVTTDEQQLRHFVGSSAFSYLVAFKRNRGARLRSRVVPTSEVLQALECAVNASESLRDQALFSCMQAGVRPVEYLSTIYHNGGGAYRFHKACHDDGRPFSYVALPAACHGPVARYIKAERLSEGELLFPSARDPEHPMSSYELARLLSKWSRDAGIKDEAVTAVGIRITTDAYKQMWEAQKFS
ncbi:hypothetical protein V2I68_19290 [Pseudomonas viridiflava]|uniref:Uncharacterized protein n=1 Tax=Pseudomonas viridiflava TaxID=33069 RepID=A0ABU7NDB4_PSEVI|nr:hypothetical protein [Pseudomonas viridiflava]MEE4042501.1 hypothetical protein [Pseudomonas viridiflava]MEE4062471.1 hypothetical protein [Pseudomonas viridiflava]MEE4171851.1 hypothetical protein [Pseudomonas viridiflava]